MRLTHAALIGLGGLFSDVPDVVADTAAREARIRFNASLPPNCTRGWRGRGNGLVAICALRDRYHVRYIDGRIDVCGAPACTDKTGMIDAFLRRQGF